MRLLDYRDLPEGEPFDKIASIGMFEHVGRANLPRYFDKICGLLKPGGLLLNHGITAGGTRNTQLGAGIGDFIERYIFPGGELLHVSHVLRVMAEQGLEGLDTENLRPHYGRTLWGWSDGLEANLDAGAPDHRRQGGARLPALPGRQRDGLRARLAVAAPDAGDAAQRADRGQQPARRTIGVPVQPRVHLPMIYKFKSKAAGDVIMLGPNGDQMLRLIGHEPAAKGIVDVEQLPAAIAALRAAVHDEEAQPAEDEDAPGRNAVSLRQRLWPVIELFERSLSEKQPVVWGV